MASILKVDTLQKPDGSTPTAADLGIDVAGSVVQTKEVVQTTTNIEASAVGVWVDVMSTTIDTTGSNAVYVHAEYSGTQGAGDGTDGIAYRILVDGVQVRLAYEEFQAGWQLRTVGLQRFVTGLSAGTHTITAQFLQVTSGTTARVNWSTAYQSNSTLLVQEIAQ